MNDPNEYFKNLFFIASQIYGLDVIGKKQFLESNHKYTYTSLNDGVIAKAEGMNKSCCVEILIDSEKWNSSEYLDKIFIMFHELGHDLFDINHSDGLRLMATNKITFEEPSVFGEMIHEMLYYLLKKQSK